MITWDNEWLFISVDSAKSDRGWIDIKERVLSDGSNVAFVSNYTSKHGFLDKNVNFLLYKTFFQCKNTLKIIKKIPM